MFNRHELHYRAVTPGVPLCYRHIITKYNTTLDNFPSVFHPYRTLNCYVNRIVHIVFRFINIMRSSIVCIWIVEKYPRYNNNILSDTKRVKKGS